MAQSDLNITPQSGFGLNLDSTSSQKKVGQMTFALNALVSSFDGEEIVIQNEEANLKCVTFPEKSKVTGVFNITEINRVVYLLTNPITGSSEIGYTDNGDCTYTTLISSPCLNFSVDSPILQIVVKSANCGYSMYWPDQNAMRYIEFDNLPWVEIDDPNNDYKKIKLVGQVDCNKLLVQPNFSIPKTEIASVVEGGVIKTGSYQFIAQYANSKGESYTSFYNPSNPISISDNTIATENFDIQTSKAINVKVEGLDNTGLFDYFNLVVIETINGVSTNKLIGTYPIADTSYTILYDGNTSTNINISSLELFQRFQHYDLAEGVTHSDDRIIWYGLKEKQRINYQPIWNKVKILWGTVKLPYTETEAYNNPENTYLYKGYMRDEVYPFEGCFLLNNGKQTESFHIPGRLAENKDLEIVSISNEDTLPIKEKECEPTPINKKKWQVYNTGSVKGVYSEYEADDCYKGPYQYGEMSYWESEEKYPNNSDIWGDLANAPIRHHKFPDELITPRFSVEGDKEFIYPIGINLDINSLYEAIQTSDLTDDQKSQIVGFKISRGDRSSGNMSIKAKGHFSNVGKYEHDTQEFYFANYPYNSIGPDPLFAINEVDNHSGYKAGLALRPFRDNQGKDQLIFHSPDTHFGRVGETNTGYIKLEAIDYGQGLGHFVKVKNNAEYKFTTQRVIQTAAVLATGVAFDVGKKGDLEFNGSDFAQVFNNTNELIEKLIPYENMGYNINSTATFNKSYPVPNEGFKLRSVDYGKYLRDGYDTIEGGKIINNFRRESSLYVHTTEPFKYAEEYSSLIPEDNSRFIYSTSSVSVEEELSDEEFFQIMCSTQDKAAISLIYGLFSAADELSEGDNNLKLVLVQYLTHLIEPYLASKDFISFKTLEDKDLDCNSPADQQPIQPNSDYHWVTKQSAYVVDPNGEVVGDFPIGDGTGGTISYNMPNTVSYLRSNEEVTFNYMSEELNLSTYQYSQVTPHCDPDDQNYDFCRLGQAIAFFIMFGKAQAKICGGRILSALYHVFEYAKQVYPQLNQTATEENLSKTRTFNVNAYYGSLKGYLPAQWGRMYSYSSVDTGFYSPLLDSQKNLIKKDPLIFGGDTFINKFSFKTKLPVYNINLVGQADQKDVVLDEEGTLGDPMFYISTKPDKFEYQIDGNALATSFEGIGVKVKEKAAGAILQQVGGVVMAVGLGLTATIVGSIAGLIVTAVGAVLYVLGSIFSNVGSKVRKAMIKVYKDLLSQVINNLGVKNINLDNARQGGVKEFGIFYQYVYGIPTYFVESQVNVDYRQATNENEGNFYPRVGTGIPDDWLQEDRVPIIHDNSYTYNKSFSKQNKESFFSHLKEDWDPTKLCSTEHQNRAFWSEKTSLNETLNNWLIYKPVSYYDFPKSFGTLTSLDGILNRQVIARFTNKTQIYNALTSVNTSTFQAYLGNQELFSSTPPVDLTETDTGSLGSQHKFLLKTPHGIIFTDVKRGQIILLQGTKPRIISNEGLSKWFQKYLTSSTLSDNHFNGEGITGVYDEFYERVIITKKGTISWTISFSFKTNSWTSWHSYLPSFYIPQTDYFQTSNNDGTLWSHNKTVTQFTNFYNTQQSYILEYPYVFKNNDEVLQSFKDYTVALKYEDYDTPIEGDDLIYFNKAVLYNNNQTTGTLNLIPRPQNSLKAYMNTQKWNVDSKDILLSKTDHYYNFNDIVDIVKNKNTSIFLSNSDPVKENLSFNQANLQYGNRSYNTPLLRAKDARVRLILDNRSDYKLLSHVNLLQTQKSYL